MRRARRLRRGRVRLHGRGRRHRPVGRPSSATDSPTVEAWLGSSLDVANSGSITVTADGNNRAASESAGVAGGIAGIGLTQGESHAEGSTKAHVDGEVKNGTGAGGTSLIIHATSTDAANTSVKAVQGGLIAAGVNQSESTVKPRVDAYIATPGTVDVSANIEVQATAHPEGDAVTRGVGIGGVQLGGTESETTVEPKVNAYITGPVVMAGPSGNITVAAVANPSIDPNAIPTYHVESTDTAADTLHVVHHGLSTGDTVQYDGPTQSGVVDGREYNVIVSGPDDLAFGAGFNGGSGVNSDTDTIAFASPHNFVTGDKVVYQPGSGGTTIAGLTPGASYWVLVLDGTHIKLTTYNPLANPSHNLQNFTPSGSTITINGHGFTNGEAVTYHAPAAKTFASLQVDVTGATNGDGVATLSDSPSANNIQFVNTTEGDANEGHPVNPGFANGDFVRYTVSGGPVIGGLSNGGTYRVADLNTGAGTLHLHAFTTTSVTFHNDGAGGATDSITRSSGDWLADGFRVGQSITISGVVGTFTLSGVSSSTLTLTADNVLTDGSAGSRSIESSTIVLTPDKTNAGKSAVHSLIRVTDLPMTYGAGNTPMDGKTFYVIVQDANHFQLAAFSGGPALSLNTTAGATGNHQIGPESIDLTSASGPQVLRIDITGGVPGAQLLGPGGVPLNIISPPTGDGVSSATASGSGGGAISVQLNDATIHDSPTVKGYVSAGLVRAGGNVSISTNSNTNATASATNATGGLVGFSDSGSTSDQTNTSEAYVGTGTRIIAGGAFTLSAGSGSQSTAATRSITGGFVGAAVANANSSITYATTATIKDAADILAGETAQVTATSSASQSVNAEALGIGFGGDGNAHARGDVPSGTTQAEVGTAAVLSGRTILISATTPQLYDHVSGDGRGGGFVAIGTASGDIDIHTVNHVLIDGSAAVTGYEGVDFRTRFDGVDTLSHTFARATGLFGHVSSDANNSTHMDSSVTGTGAALVTAGPREGVTAGYDHLAFYVDTSNGSISASHTSDSSKRSLATGGDNGDGSGSLPTAVIDFSSDVRILSGLNPELVVDSGGQITTAKNVSVNDAAGGNSNRTSGTIVDGTIRVNNIFNDDPGQVYFSTGGTGIGQIKGSGGIWEFRDTFEYVRIINNSSKPLQVNAVNVVNTTVDPIVDLLNTNALTMTYAIVRTVRPSLVDVESFNPSRPPIIVNGVINNPIGTTRIVNRHGDIQSTGNRANGDADPTSLIRTNILDLETPEGSVGQTAHRVNVDVVDSASVPQATGFLSARVSGADGSISLGRNIFFTGELVRYTAAGAALGGLTSGDYYYVIASDDGLSLKLASVSSPSTPILVTPTGSPTDAHSLTPAQRFTVFAAGDADTGRGTAYMDVKGRLRDASLPYSVIVDAVNTTSDANLLLRGSVQETDVSGVTYPGATAGTAGGVLVKFEGNGGVRHFDFFRPDTPPGPALDPGVFAFAGTGATHIDSTYDMRALDATGAKIRPGITSGRNIIVAAAQPLAGAGRILNVLGITEIVGTGYVAGASDQHHIDVLTNGSIILSEKTDDLRVGEIRSTASDVTLNAPAAIVDALNDGLGSNADVTGRNLTMTAGNNQITGTSVDRSGRGGIGSPGNFLEINVDANGGLLGVLNATDTASATTPFSDTSPPFDSAASGTYGVFLTETAGDMKIDTVHTKGDVTLATAAGSLVDARSNGAGDDTANVIGNTINLYAVGGNIGNPAAGAEYNQAQLNTNNDLEIDSQRYTPGTIGARASDSIYLTETAHDARVVLVQALTGDARFTVRESNLQGEDLHLLPSGNVLFLENAPESLAHGLVNTPQGTAMLRVGDNVDTDPNAQILAGRNINIFGDYRRDGIDVVGPTDSPQFGTVMHLQGVIAHGPTASGYLTRIFGNDDSDQIYFDQTFLGGTNPLLPSGSNQAIPQGGVLGSAYSGGKTRVYGSDTPTATGAFAPVGDGEDFFLVNLLQSMAYVQTAPADASSDTLTIDGQSGTDTVVVNAAGSLGAQRNYVINVLDTGAPDDGVDSLAVWGRDSSVEGEGQPADDIFLLRRTTDISGETSGPSLYADNTAFVAVVHDDLAHAVASDPNNNSAVRNQTLERVNYDSSINGRLMVFGQGGNDVFAVDDNAAITTLDGGTGNDTFQLGQLYGLQRDGKQPPSPRPLGDTSGGSLVTPDDLFPQLVNSLTPQSLYGTVATTRGWLSAGATSPLLAQGGQGNDKFTVYSNQAVVRLEGDDGNDLFTVRAFALAATINTGTSSEEIDWIDPEKLIARPKLTAGFSTAAETDIRTGAGNNQVEYNINAPVSVDGGPGFDKLVVLGTEFADHIVVTEKGIFGAGLTVTYQNIEVLEIDALEGDDTIDVLSTQPDVATRVIGGLGNDQINVAGDVAGEVVSRDIEGTSGVINNRLSSVDPGYDGRPADGIDVSVARPTQGQVIIDESGGASDGFTEVREGGLTDSYKVYLAKAPTSKVYVTVSGAMSPQEEHGNAGYLGSGDIVDNLGTGDSLLVSETPADYDRDIYIDGTLVHIPKRAIVLVFDPTHWDINSAKTVYVSAVDDSLAEGDRTVTISHSVLSADPVFNHAIVRNVEATVIDNDQPGLVITQLDTNGPAVADNKTIVLEGEIDGTHAVNDLYSVQLTIAPAGPVYVKIQLSDSEAVLSSYDADPTGRFQTTIAPTADTPGVYSLKFDASNWNMPFRVAVAARYDSAPEDPHNTTISHTIDTTATTDPTYKTTPVVERRVDVRVIDDENPGLFLLESGGKTLVSAGSAQGGPGTGDSYTIRLTSAPTATVKDALITDGQTDVVAGAGVAYEAIGDLQAVSLFDGNISVAGNTVTRRLTATLAAGSTTASSPVCGSGSRAWVISRSPRPSARCPRRC